MTLEEIFNIVVPCLVSISTSGIGSAIISSIAKKTLRRKVEKLDESKNIKEINRSIARIEREIMEMRGKRR